MIGVLILTHGPFGENLLKTAMGIMRDQEKATALNISRRLDFETLRRQVSEAIESLHSEEGVLVLIDAYGGTSYNTTLPMVLSALANRQRLSLLEVAKKVSEDAKKTVAVMIPDEWKK